MHFFLVNICLCLKINVALKDVSSLVKFLLFEIILREILQRAIEQFFDCPGQTFDLNNLSNILNICQLMNPIHITHINTELAHVHFQRVTINDNYLARVKPMGQIWYFVLEYQLWSLDDFIVFACLLLLTHGAEHKGSW